MTMLEAEDGRSRSDLVPDPADLRLPSPEELVERYQKRVYAVIYRMTGRHADTDDLCQETFLQIIRSLPSFKPGTKLDSWVYRIAMNVSVDHLRRVGKGREALETLSQTSPTAPPGGLDSESSAAVRRAVDSLPPEQKAVVILRIHEGLSHDRIAEIVEAPVATVRWRLFSALEKLEAVLGHLAGPGGGSR
jgi:RNA polymerase sigma-70 factor (ECF subfamily)